MLILPIQDAENEERQEDDRPGSDQEESNAGASGDSNANSSGDGGDSESSSDESSSSGSEDIIPPSKNIRFSPKRASKTKATREMKRMKHLT